jgi:hypothetical protein
VDRKEGSYLETGDLAVSWLQNAKDSVTYSISSLPSRAGRADNWRGYIVLRVTMSKLSLRRSLVPIKRLAEECQSSEIKVTLSQC